MIFGTLEAYEVHTSHEEIPMPKPTESELQDILVAHMSATTAAFQMLVICLQDNGALERGQFPSALHAYMEMAKDRSDPMTLSLLDDLRQALLN
jgi:hypothetical protein